MLTAAEMAALLAAWWAVESVASRDSMKERRLAEQLDASLVVNWDAWRVAAMAEQLDELLDD